MSHHHGQARAGVRAAGRVSVAAAIALLILAAEVAGGIVAHSLVLLADAGHMLADVAGLSLSLLAISFARRPPTDARTFGYQRTEILAAVCNAVLLLGVGAFVIVQSSLRLVHPERATPSIMVVIGAVALAGNAISLLLLRPTRAHSLSHRGAYLEVLSDLMGAIAVLVAAAVISVSSFERADPIASIVIGVLIVPRAARLLRAAVDVLLEATPREVDLAEVRSHICDTAGVLDVHDLHAWTVASGLPVLSAHVVVSDEALADGGGARVLDELAECLVGHFDVEHCTFQLEPATHQRHERALHR